MGIKCNPVFFQLNLFSPFYFLSVCKWIFFSFCPKVFHTEPLNWIKTLTVVDFSNLIQHSKWLHHTWAGSAHPLKEFFQTLIPGNQLPSKIAFVFVQLFLNGWNKNIRPHMVYTRSKYSVKALALLCSAETTVHASATLEPWLHILVAP